MAKQLPTKEDVLRVIPAKCTNCGTDGEIYPYPEGKGSMFCPVCSPFWLKSFLEFSTNQMRAAI